MKQFILAKNFNTSSEVTSLNDGDICFVAKNEKAATNDVTKLKDECNLVCKEGEYVNYIPFYNNKFKFEKSEYNAGTKSKATIKLTDTYNKGVYTLVLIKKGVQFDEQNKWSVSTYVAKDGMTAANLAIDLHKQLSKIAFVKATNSAGTITVEPLDKNVEIKVIATDGFAQNTPNITYVEFVPTLNTAAQIKDLYEKCAADRGVNYTYEEPIIYPNMPFNPLKGSDSVDGGFTVFTLRFAEPRQTKTTDEVVNQVVHVAFPTSATDAINNFNGLLTNLENPSTVATAAAIEEPTSVD